MRRVVKTSYCLFNAEEVFERMGIQYIVCTIYTINRILYTVSIYCVLWTISYILNHVLCASSVFDMCSNVCSNVMHLICVVTCTMCFKCFNLPPIS